MVFLEIPNVLLGTVFAETVTYMQLDGRYQGHMEGGVSGVS